MHLLVANTALSNGHHPPRTPPPSHIHHSPAPNGLVQMSLPYDPSRRRSLGGPGSPPPNGQGTSQSWRRDARALTRLAGHHESLPPPPSFQSRQMPPPSPPPMPSSASSLPNSTPRGPPTASPFAGARDLASFSSNRPGGAMSLSSILGNSEERQSQSSPQTQLLANSPPKSMPPPSPGRARATSMREPFSRGLRDVSPPRNHFGEQRPLSAVLGHDRVTSEPRRDGTAASPIFQHGFRAYHPPQQEQRQSSNGYGLPGRPSSQPADQGPPRSVDEIIRRDAPPESHFATFRHFAEPQGLPPRNDAPRHDTAAFPNGHGRAPQQADRGLFNSPQLDRERDRGPPPPMRFAPGSFGTPMADERPGLFRPAYPPGQEPPRESIEMRYFQGMRREPSRSSPPLSDLISLERGRNGFPERPMTLEEHQRLESQLRDAQRKESDGSTHRALLNVSPELNRKGRNSPLPQAVQGAQPRHVAPGGDNPGIKSEFGRMFSGLGSGVGTATPNAGQSVNGTTTPSRMTPPRHIESGDLVSTAVAEIHEEGRSGGKIGGRGKKNGRRSRDEDGINGTGTPDGQRGSKKSKTSHPTHHHHHVHPHHHHHHHHHEPPDNGPSPFNMLRFPPNPIPQSSGTPNAAHHHHYHHGGHAHPGHHHHHTPRTIPPARKQTTSVMSRRLVEDSAKKPRKHLGSQLYTTEISRPPLADFHVDSKIKFSSKMKPIPVLQGKENCTYTVRVPRWYLTTGHSGGHTEEPSYLEEIGRRRQLWGTDVYTDDTDVIAAAIHSGWLKGDFGDANDDLRELCGNDSEQDDPREDSQATLAIRPRKPVKVPPDHDAHITLLLLPPLEFYPSTTRHHIRSREWKDTHDGMSFMIHRIEFVDEGSASRNVGRSVKARKQRLALEETKRKEAAAGLLMFANGNAGVQVNA